MYTVHPFWAISSRKSVENDTPCIIGKLPKLMIQNEFSHCGQNTTDIRLNFPTAVEFVGFDGQPAFDFEIGHEDFQPEDFRLLGGAS